MLTNYGCQDTFLEDKIGLQKLVNVWYYVQKTERWK